MNTWTLVEPSKTANILKGQWVYALKHGLKGEILKYKARWVVKGYNQILGIDYFDCFAPVIKPISYKLLFSLAAILDWEIDQMDVKIVFSNGYLSKAIYVE